MRDLQRHEHSTAAARESLESAPRLETRLAARRAGHGLAALCSRLGRSRVSAREEIPVFELSHT